MITTDQIDRLCVVAYRVIQGDTHMLDVDDWDFLDEVSVHAEDVLAQEEHENHDCANQIAPHQLAFSHTEESWYDPYEALEDEFAEDD